jgi:cytochrome c biogenesis protein CcmG, thiol:disulfide interchange protein DsbE
MRSLRRAAICAVLPCLALPAGIALAARLKQGDHAPKFTITLYDNQKVTSDQLAGEVIVINRWAAWCVPCKKEIPELDAYYRAHSREGLRIFAIPVDDSASNKWMHAVASTLAFPLGKWSSGSAFPDLAGVPTNYVIDRHGVIRYAKAGAFDAQDLNAVVGPLLAEPSSASPATTVATSATH